MKIQDELVWRAAQTYLEHGWDITPVSAVSQKLTGESRICSAKLPVSLKYIFCPISSKAMASSEVFSGHGIGIKTGKNSGLIVIDVDAGLGADNISRFHLPETRMVRTGTGCHLYFQHPGSEYFIPNAPGVLMEGIDVKGEGAHVVAPPSLHANGQSYQWMDENAPIVTLPDDFLSLILKLPHRPQWKLARNVIVNKYFRHPLNVIKNVQLFR